MLPRVLETEAMDAPDEAADYDSMDHSEVNGEFVDDLLAVRPDPGDLLDLGTGTALIPVELCRRTRSVGVVAVDAAENMLAVARQNIERAGLADRIQLHRVDAKRLPYGDGQFAAVMSNSIVHHVPEPREVLDEAWRVTAPGGLLFIRDLLRPDSDETVRRLVDMYAGEANAHQRQMFDDSLRAALTVDEIRALIARYGVDPNTVRATTDRHWTWVAEKK